MASTLLWYRLDLRVADHPALTQACASGGPVIPAFIWDPEAEGEWAPGTSSRWWLRHSLAALEEELSQRGSKLILRSGVTLEVLRALVKETGATSIHWSRRYEPAVESRDADLQAKLKGLGCDCRIHPGNVAREPESLRTQSGNPYKVFTPFWRAFEAAEGSLGEARPPAQAPKRIPAPEHWPKSSTLASLGIQEGKGDPAGLETRWKPGSAAAKEVLDRFIADAMEDYPVARNIPADPGTSHLSPYLHFGEITPRQIRHAISKSLSATHGGNLRETRMAAQVFLKELVWREFAHHILVHFPHTPTEPLRPEFAGFPWAKGAEAKAHLQAWKHGKTGYPFVDAGLRELASTGTMHNRVRMAAASFLVKHLLIPWQEGARWFWEKLVDADLAQNSMNWQWVAGSGADAAPYFRIFNPVLQGQRFDPHGDYVRKWVPEIGKLPNKYIHCPFEAPPIELASAGIELGKTYPKPLVSHRFARERALASFGGMKQVDA